MNWQYLVEILQQSTADIDLSLAMRPETLLAILVAFIAVQRKRGFLRAALFTLFCCVSMVVLWNQTLITQGDFQFNFYMAGLLTFSSVILLYIVYLYTIQEQVD